MNKAERERDRRELTLYVIEKAFGKVKGVYRISKQVLDHEVDAYHVTVKLEGDDTTVQLWCDCQGFRRQKFPQLEHKHIRIALHYQSIGEPTKAIYRLKGVGQATKVQFIKEHK